MMSAPAWTRDAQGKTQAASAKERVEVRAKRFASSSVTNGLTKETNDHGTEAPEIQ
jgi:hypothetical protein